MTTNAQITENRFRTVKKNEKTIVIAKFTVANNKTSINFHAEYLDSPDLQAIQKKYIELKDPSKNIESKSSYKTTILLYALAITFFAIIAVPVLTVAFTTYYTYSNITLTLAVSIISTCIMIPISIVGTVLLFLTALFVLLLKEKNNTNPINTVKKDLLKYIEEDLSFTKPTYNESSFKYNNCQDFKNLFYTERLSETIGEEPLKVPKAKLLLWFAFSLFDDTKSAFDINTGVLQVLRNRMLFWNKTTKKKIKNDILNNKNIKHNCSEEGTITLAAISLLISPKNRFIRCFKSPPNNNKFKTFLKNQESFHTTYLGEK